MAKADISINLNQAIKQFCVRLTADNRAAGTISAYRRDLLMVAGVISDLTPDSDSLGVTPTLLDSAFSSPAITITSRGPRSVASLHRMKGAVRSFFSWAFESGITPDNPARMLRMQRLPRKPPSFLTQAEKKKLLKEVKGRSRFMDLRDRMMIELLLGTGIRLAELTGLNVNDIDLASKHLRVITKGNIPQVKFLKTDLRSLLQRYLLIRQRQPTKSDALFLSNRASRLCQRQIANRINHWLTKAGIEKHLTPHSMRHTFATHLYSATNDLLIVQRALGHRDISTTQIYTHLVDGQLEEALERL